MLRYIAPMLILLGHLSPSVADDFSRSYQSITQNELAGHIQILASDEYEGRAPGGIGEDKTMSYLSGQFKSLGFTGSNKGSFLQPVPLVEITPGNNTRLKISGKELTYKKDYVAVTRHLSDKISLGDAELVFVGYGINAPEYQWNDYQYTDVKGKIAVVLVNDPGFATEDEQLFDGKAMTYYGRWTYKYEEASRQGAAGVFIIHETDAASYPWSVVENGWTGAQFDLTRKDNNASRVKAEGWLHINAARRIFKTSGLDLDKQMASAKSRHFRAVALNQRASLTINSTIKKSTSRNFMASLPGTTRKDEHIIFMGHWDHMGVDYKLDDDPVYNGAQDNASGVAGLIEIAEAFSLLKQRPERSVTFIAMAAEEQGLLGSAHYVENPVVPLNKTVAVINMDSLNVAGRVKDIIVIGYGKSELDTYLTRAGNKQNRPLSPEPAPEAGGFYRSDHFNFAKKGVPALYAKGGSEARIKSDERRRRANLIKLKKCYHQPCDEMRPFWQLDGAVEDLQLFFDVGYQLAHSSHFPEWHIGTEFKKARDDSMKK